MKGYRKKITALLLTLVMVFSALGGISLVGAEGLTQVFLQDFATDVVTSGSDSNATYTLGNAPARGTISVADGKLKLETTADLSVGYYLKVLANSVSQWSGGEGTSALSAKFTMDANTDYVAFGGEIATTDAEDAIIAAAASGDAYVSEFANDWGRYRGGTNNQSYLQIFPSKIVAFGKTHPVTVDTTSEHTVDLYVYGDNTYSLYLDGTEIAKDEAMMQFIVRYTYYAGANNTKKREVTLTDVGYFRGFYEIYMMHYKKSGTASTMYFDDLSIKTAATKCYLGSSVVEVTEKDVFSIDFTDFTTGNASTVTTEPASSGAVTFGPKNSYVTFNNVSDPFNGDDGVYNDALYIKEAVGSTGGGSNPINITVNKFAGYESGTKGSSVLTYDFAFDNNAKGIGIQANINTTEFDIGGTKYTSGKIGFGTDENMSYGNLLYITPTSVKAFNQEKATSLARNAWHRLVLVVNGDNTFSLSIDGLFLFGPDTSMSTEDSKVLVRYVSPTYKDITGKATFMSFDTLNIFLDGSGKEATADNGAYFDNIAIKAKYDAHYVDSADETDYAGNLAKAKEELQIYRKDLCSNLALDGYGILGTTITWQSSNTDAVGHDGTVYPKVGVAQTAVMTAVISIEGYPLTETKTFDITIPAVSPYDIEGVKVTGADGIEDTALVGGKKIEKISVRRYAETAEELMAIVALYNGNKLEDITINYLTPGIERYAYGDITLTKPLSLPNQVTGFTAKVMFFKSVNTITPLADAYTVNPIDENITIYMAGDSTMTNYTASTYPQAGWGQMLGTNAYLDEANVTIDNTQPAGGRSTRSFIVEGRLDYIEDNIEAGDYIFVQFGHNDSKYTYEEGKVGGTTGNVYINDTTNLTNRHTGIGSYATNDQGVAVDVDGDNYSYFAYLEQFVDVAKNAGANIVLFTSFNRAGKNANNLCGYPAAMKAFAAERNVPVIDTTAISVDLYNKTLEATPEDYVANGVEASSYPRIFGQNLFLFVKAGGDGRYTGDNATKLAASSYKNGAADSTHFDEYGASARAKLAIAALCDAKHPLSRYENINAAAENAADAMITEIIGNIPQPYWAG